MLSNIKLNQALEIRHNVPEIFLSNTTRAFVKFNPNEYLNQDELIFKSNVINPIKNMILKIYLKNITVENGEIAILKCPSVFISTENKESQMNEYFKIKTVSLIFILTVIFSLHIHFH